MSEPKSVRAGDTWIWTREEADYPASSYVLTYHFRNETAKINIIASADGDTHSVNVAASTTAGYIPGVYRWGARVVGTLGTFTVGEGTTEVLPNIGLDVLMDARTLAQKALDAIEAYLIDPTNLAAASYSLGGRSLSRWSRSELLVERDRWINEVKSQQAESRMSQGLGNPRRLYVRFDRG